jgi:hypothetical protein
MKAEEVRRRIRQLALEANRKRLRDVVGGAPIVDTVKTAAVAMNPRLRSLSAAIRKPDES